MNIRTRVKLGNTNYYISCECEYKKKDGITQLCLKDYIDDYYDGGDLSLLIKEIEDNYNKDIVKKYDGDVWFLADALYIYDNIPFISGLGDFYITNDDNTIRSISYISKEELDTYIKDNNIFMKDNSEFKLYDGRTWNVK